MHFVYGFCDGNACAAGQEYQRRFPDRRIPFRSVFTRIHQTLRDNGSLPSVSLQSEREVVRTINTRENILSASVHSTLVYETKVDSRAALRDRIFAAANHIRNHPHNISSATESLLIRAENCIGTGGGHFEKVL